MRTSVADYLADFQRLGNEQAYAERVGYRLVRWTYSSVAALAFRFARELTASGIHKGDRVVLWGPNSAAWVAAFLGCANRGVIAVPMDDAASPDFAIRVFQQVQARLLVCWPANSVGPPSTRWARVFWTRYCTALRDRLTTSRNLYPE